MFQQFVERYGRIAHGDAVDGTQAVVGQADGVQRHYRQAEALVQCDGVDVGFLVEHRKEGRAVHHQRIHIGFVAVGWANHTHDVEPFFFQRLRVIGIIDDHRLIVHELYALVDVADAFGVRQTHQGFTAVFFAENVVWNLHHANVVDHDAIAFGVSGVVSAFVVVVVLKKTGAEELADFFIGFELW